MGRAGTGYTMQANGSDVQRVTTAGGAEPIWSPDGTRIAFYSFRDGDGEIYTMRGDGAGQTRLTNMPGTDANPTWAPDGALIAFQTNFPASQIHVMDADGANEHAITSGAPTNFQPDWSPDGRRIVYSRATEGGLGVWVMDADGGNPRPVTGSDPADADQDPVWSPDGSRVAFARNDEIFVVHADGTGAVNLTNNPATDGEPCWSPDGSLIGFSSDRAGNTDIWTMRTDGSGATRVTDDPGTDTHCEWQARPRGAAPSLELRVQPRRVRAGRRRAFSFRVTSDVAGKPVAGARIGFAGRTVRTDGRGRAVMTARLRHPGRRLARASKTGLGRSIAAVRVVPRG